MVRGCQTSTKQPNWDNWVDAEWMLFDDERSPNQGTRADGVTAVCRQSGRACKACYNNTAL